MANRMDRGPVAGEDMGRGAGGRAAHRRNPSLRTSGGFPSSGFPVGIPPLSSPAGFDCNLGDEESAQHGSFLSFFNNPFIPHSAFSSPGATTSNKFIDLDKEDTSPLGPTQNNTRTEDRLLWKQNEDVRLMNAWLKHSVDSINGNAKKGEKYWGDVVKEYDLTTPQDRKRNQKQVKERWHKINKWTNWFNDAWIKVKGIYTSGYSDEMWIEKAHKMYEADHGDAKFNLMDVWNLCRYEAKWISYNNKAGKKRKGVQEGQEEDLARVHLDLNEIPGSSIALPPEVRTTPNPCFAQVLQRNAAIQARSTHVELKKDLVEHIWNRYGTQ